MPFFVLQRMFPMIEITLPDGSKRPFAHPVTVQDVAASIGSGLAKATLAGKVDGKLVDASFAIDHDATLAIVTDKDRRRWRSCATPPRTCWRRRCSGCSRTRRSRSAR